MEVAAGLLNQQLMKALKYNKTGDASYSDESLGDENYTIEITEVDES